MDYQNIKIEYKGTPEKLRNAADEVSSYRGRMLAIK